MKISILKHMRPNHLYFREELALFSKRIDFELSHLLESEMIKKCYQGIYTKAESIISDTALIEKIISRDRKTLHLIIPASELPIAEGLSSNDYICLNHKRSDLISTSSFKIKFQIPTHGFPKKLTSNFIKIYQLNTSSNLGQAITDIELDFEKIDSIFLKDLKKFGNKKAYKFISDEIIKRHELKNIFEDLGSIGAPLILSKKTGERHNLTKELIVSKALEIGINEPRIHNILPFTILKNASGLDFKKLEDLTKKNGTYRYAGFILELLKKTGHENIPEFRAPKYPKKPTILFKEIYGRRGLERLKSQHLDFALNKWGILIDTKIDSEREKIRKWL